MPLSAGLQVNERVASNLNRQVAVDERGRIYVAWTERRGSFSEVYLRRWNGATWEGLAGSDQTPVSADFGAATLSSLILDPGSGLPILAWRQEGTSGGRAIYVSAYDGQRWSGISGSASGNGISSARSPSWPALVSDNNGGLYVGWETVSAPGGIHVWRSVDRGAWAELSPGNSRGLADGPAPALVRLAYGGDALHAVWQQSDGLRHASWLGDRWQSSRLSDSGSRPQVAVLMSGAAVVAWQTGALAESESALGIVRRDDSVWMPLGQAGLAGLLNPRRPSLAGLGDGILLTFAAGGPADESVFAGELFPGEDSWKVTPLRDEDRPTGQSATATFPAVTSSGGTDVVLWEEFPEAIAPANHIMLLVRSAGG